MPRTIIKSGGQWRTALRIYYKHAGVQRPIRKIWKKYGGVWRLVFGDLGGTLTWNAGQTGTWTVPAAVYSVTVTAIGGGGGGGYGHEDNCEHGGGGGGSGGVQTTTIAVTPGDVISFSVGVGGAGSVNKTTLGTAGTATTFGPVTSTGGGLGGSPTNKYGLAGTAGTPGGMPGQRGHGEDLDGNVQCVYLARGGGGGTAATYGIQTLILQQVGGSPAYGDNNMQSFWFSPDGANLYTLGTSTKSVFRYTLSSPWNIGTATYVSKKTGMAGNPEAIQFKPDGTRMYVVAFADDILYDYPLSTAWDITTAGTPVKKGCSHWDNGMMISYDGTKIYLVSTQDSPRSVVQRTLTTAWSITTMTTNVYEVYPGGSTLTGTSIHIDPSGTQLYMSYTNGQVKQFTMTTPWQINTIVDTGKVFTCPYDGVINAVRLSQDGTKLYVLGNDSDYLYQYNLQTAWDITVPAPYGQGGKGGYPGNSYKGQAGTGVGAGGGGGGAKEVDGTPAPWPGAAGTGGRLTITW